VLAQNAPKALTQETLEQRARRYPRACCRPHRKGRHVPPKPQLAVREIVSEYSVGALKESESGNLGNSAR